MQKSSGPILLVLVILVAGVLMAAGCTAPSTTSPATVPPPATTAGQPTPVQPPQATPAVTTIVKDQDTQFLTALSTSMEKMSPLFEKVSADINALNLGSLKTSAKALSDQCAADLVTIGSFKVSESLQPVQSNYLKALTSFQEAGDKMEKSIIATENGDSDTASRLITEAGTALTTGSEYIKEILATAQKS